MARKSKEYALYKGDELLGIGTIKELSEELGVLPETIYFYKSSTYAKRGPGKNRRVLVAVED